MKQFTLTCFLLSLFAFAVAAQDAPRAEVFAGYSLVRNSVPANFHGWQASVAGNLTDRVGVVAEFNGNYKRQFGINQRYHGFNFGPRFSARTKYVTPFAHALFGATRNSWESWSITTMGSPVVLGNQATAFSMKVGGGLDVKINQRLSYRVAQADWYLTRYSSFHQNNLGISTGLVFNIN